MTRHEAEAVALAISYVDGGCPHCVAGVCERLNAAAVGWSFAITGKGGHDQSLVAVKEAA